MTKTESWKPNRAYSVGDTVTMGTFVSTCKVNHTSCVNVRNAGLWRMWDMQESMSKSVIKTFFQGIQTGMVVGNEEVLQKLLTAFDEQIDAEKGARDKNLKGLGDLTDISAARIESFDQGRIDGVDTGRALVEEVLGDDDDSVSE